MQGSGVRNSSLERTSIAILSRECAWTLSGRVRLVGGAGGMAEGLGGLGELGVSPVLSSEPHRRTSAFTPSAMGTTGGCWADEHSFAKYGPELNIPLKKTRETLIYGFGLFVYIAFIILRFCGACRARTGGRGVGRTPGSDASFTSAPSAPHSPQHLTPLTPVLSCLCVFVVLICE